MSGNYWISAPEVSHRLVSLLRETLVDDAASRLSVREDRILLDIRYLSRCSLYTLRLLEDPQTHLDRYRDPTRLAWSIIHRGAQKLVKELSEAQSPEEQRLPAPAELGTPITVEAPSGVTINYQDAPRDVYLVADVDMYNLESGEVALIRLTRSSQIMKTPSATGPPRHHLEELAAAKWTLKRAGYPVSDTRIIYLQPETGQMIEYKITLQPSETAIKERIRHVFEGNLAPCYGFECSACPFRDTCPLAVTNPEPACEAVDRYGLRVKPLYSLDSLRVDWDPTMKHSSRIHEALMRMDLEFTAYHIGEDAKRSSTALNVTHLNTCPLKYWFAKRMPYTSSVPSPYLVRGRLLHNGIEETLGKAARNCRLLKKYGLRLIDVERRLRRTLDIGGGGTATLYGRADLVLTTEDCETVVIELKTYKKSPRDLWGPDQGPRETHKTQASVYVSLLEADRGYVVYVDPSEIHEDTVYAHNAGKMPHSLIEEEARRLLFPSEQDIPRHEWECRYCPYREICPIVKLRNNNSKKQT